MLMIIWDSSAIHRVSHRPEGPQREKNVDAGLHPERVRRQDGVPPKGAPRAGGKRVMISRGGGFPRTGRRCAGSEAVDPIGVALSITAGERSHPRTGTTHHSDPMGVELHADVVRIAGRRQAGVGFSAVTIVRSAASLLRGCACGLPAVVGSWTPMGSAYLLGSFPQVRLWLTRGYRKFAPYGGAGLAVYLMPRRTFYRTGICLRRNAIHRVSHRADGHHGGENAMAGLRPER